MFSAHVCKKCEWYDESTPKNCRVFLTYITHVSKIINFAMRFFSAAPDLPIVVFNISAPTRICVFRSALKPIYYLGSKQPCSSTLKVLHSKIPVTDFAQYNWKRASSSTLSINNYKLLSQTPPTKLVIIWGYCYISKSTTLLYGIWSVSGRCGSTLRLLWFIVRTVMSAIHLSQNSVILATTQRHQWN